MLNKIFTSHWKGILILGTVGFIGWAVLAALFWIPPVARVVETTMTLDELMQKNESMGNQKAINPK